MTILCYHTVDPSWSDPLAVTPAELVRQCRWLARRRDVIDLDAATAARASRAGGRTVALTFDDGFAGVFDFALPILRRFGFPFAVFVVTRTLTDPDAPVDWIDQPPDPPPTTMTLEQLLELRESGATIASHSHTHRVLPALTEAECLEDLRTSREVLESLLGRPVPHVAYPRGLHDAKVRRAAARAGFTAGFSLPNGRETARPFAVPRVGIYRGNSMLAFRLKMTRTLYPRVIRPSLASILGRDAPPPR